ncbi:MAG: LCP family protein [Clostridia bacterium]|nr:LCP family protein [Clostridia bacterium]
MKLRPPVVVLLIISLVVSFICVVYFWIGIPVLELIFNPADDTGSHGFITITGSDVLNLDDLHSGFVPDDSYQMEGEYKPVGEIGNVTYVTGNQVKFEEGTKNILLLGISDEALCDSIFVLNVNEASKEVKIVSIPRDAYVPYTDDIVNAMIKAGYYYSPGSCKINAALYVGSSIVRYNGGKFGNSGIDFLCAIIDNLFAYGCEIDEYVQVDLYGFMDIIDIVGGVYVTSDEVMYKTYPDGSKEVWVTEGTQKMDAKTALFYVRNRTKFTSTGENAYAGGDEYRKTNQVKFLAEVSSQILTKDNLKLSNVTDLLQTLKENVKHSFGDNLSEYIDIGLDFANGGYKIGMYVVTGEEIDPMGDNASYVKIY